MKGLCSIEPEKVHFPVWNFKPKPDFEEMIMMQVIPLWKVKYYAGKSEYYIEVYSTSLFELYQTLNKLKIPFDVDKVEIEKHTTG